MNGLPVIRDSFGNTFCVGPDRSAHGSQSPLRAIAPSLLPIPMEKPPVIFTHAGKLGDMLYCLPIAHAWWKQTGRKVHWVLPRCFPPFRYVDALLLMQEATAGVTFVDHPCEWSGHGGQPYRFDPVAHLQKVGWDLGYSPRPRRASSNPHDNDVFNLGFRGYPDKFVTAFQAEEHGLPWDKDFVLATGGPVEPSEERLRGEQRELAEMAPHTTQWPMDSDLLELVRRLKAAREVHTWYSGGAALCFMARIPFTLHREPGHPDRRLYLPADLFGGAGITERVYVRKV